MPPETVTLHADHTGESPGGDAHIHLPREPVIASKCCKCFNLAWNNTEMWLATNKPCTCRMCVSVVLLHSWASNSVGTWYACAVMCSLSYGLQSVASPRKRLSTLEFTFYTHLDICDAQKAQTGSNRFSLPHPDQGFGYFAVGAGRVWAQSKQPPSIIYPHSMSQMA